MMKVWQLMNVVSKDDLLIDQLKDYRSTDYLPETLVVKLLSQSCEMFSICKDNNLRLSQSNYSFDIHTVEVINAVVAYQRFGGTALCEAVDFGSWKIN